MNYTSKDNGFTKNHTVENTVVEITNSKYPDKDGNITKQLHIHTSITTESTFNGESVVNDIFSGSGSTTFEKNYHAWRKINSDVTKPKAIKAVKDGNLIAMKLSAPNVILTPSVKRQMEKHGATLAEIREQQSFVTKKGLTLYSIGFIAPFGKPYLGLMDIFGLSKKELSELKDEFNYDAVSVSLKENCSWLADEVADEVETDELEAAQNQFEDIFSD